MVAAPVNPAHESAADPQLDWVSNASNVGGVANSAPDVTTAWATVVLAVAACVVSAVAEAGSRLTDALITGTVIFILPSV